MTTTAPRRQPAPGQGSSHRKALGLRPGLDYLMLRTVIFVLIGIGLLMAYSASMATAVAENASVWSLATRQTLMVLAGLVVFWLALRTPPTLIRRLTPIFVIVAIVLLLLVLTPLGTGGTSVGSQSWIVVGPISIQPSEVARVAIALCGASMLANHQHQTARPRNVGEWLHDPYVAYAGISGVMFLLIMLQGDVGMALSFALVVLFALLFAGTDWRFFLMIPAVAVAGGLYIFGQGGYRSDRFRTYFDALTGHIEDTQDTGFQSYQGFLSLADGGVLGVGPGQSRAKWFYLPEARNDFVFAIVGEELGLWGAALVIILFALLGIFGIRTALRAQNTFQALMAATLSAAVVSQAFVNISYVIGLLPVTGIQLPMISSGGSATIITIGAMGLLCNVARHEPAQISAIQSTGRPLFDRIFRIPEPLPAARKRSAPKPESKNTPPSKQAGPIPPRPRPRTVAPLARRNSAARARFGQPVTGRRTGRGGARR